jgi:hypothetical protein
MGLRIHALCIEAEVLRQVVDELALVLWHRFEPKPFLVIVGCEQSETFLVGCCPCRVLHIEVQRDIRVGNMVGLMLWIDVERQCKLAVTLKTSALLITLQSLLAVAFAGLGSITLRFLFYPLTLAGDDNFVLTRPILFAWLRKVAGRHVRVTADTQLLAASLLARFFALTATVTLLLAFVYTAFESTTADLAAANFAEPARLVLDNILAAQAVLGGQVWALGAVFFVAVTVVANLRVTAALWSLAREAAWRWSRTTGKRRLQYCPTAIAANLVEDGIPTSTARTFVTELLAAMFGVAAFQLATTGTRANMFCFKVVSRSLGC